MAVEGFFGEDEFAIEGDFEDATFGGDDAHVGQLSFKLGEEVANQTGGADGKVSFRAVGDFDGVHMGSIAPRDFMYTIYTPELNPEEYCHSNVRTYISNATPEDQSQIRKLPERGFALLHHRPDMLPGFICSISLYDSNLGYPGQL